VVRNQYVPYSGSFEETKELPIRGYSTKTCKFILLAVWHTFICFKKENAATGYTPTNRVLFVTALPALMLAFFIREPTADEQNGQHFVVADE